MARQELTLKQQKFIKYYVECGNLTEAAEKAGYKCTSKKSFCQIGRETLENLGYKIKPILAAKGLDGFKFSEILNEGLALPAKYAVRHKYLETFGKVADFFAPEKHEITGKDGKPIAVEPKGSIFDKLEKYASLFESNGGAEKGSSPGNGSGESLDTPPTDDKTS